MSASLESFRSRAGKNAARGRMTTEPSLLQAVAADPSDPLVWQALADWLEESGQDGRAELARLVLRLRLERGHRHRWRWQKRVQELLAAGVRPCVPEMTNSVGMRLVLVPPGTCRLGSPENEAGDMGSGARPPPGGTRAS